MTAVDANGRPIHEDGLDTLAGLAIVQVPGLDRRPWSTTPAAATWSWARTRT